MENGSADQGSMKAIILLFLVDNILFDKIVITTCVTRTIR